MDPNCCLCNHFPNKFIVFLILFQFILQYLIIILSFLCLLMMGPTVRTMYPRSGHVVRTLGPSKKSLKETNFCNINCSISSNID